MRIGVLSYNLAGVDDLSNKVTDASVIRQDPDIYIEMTQEDPRNPSAPALLKAEILSNYIQVANYSVNQAETKPNNIVIKMYSKLPLENINKYQKAVSPNTLFTLKGVGQYLMPFSNKGYSKGMVCLKATLGGKPCIFVNMHLPVQSRYNNMGLQYRKDIFYELLTDLKDQVSEDTFIFIGGDLNFRMNIEGCDQLTNILSNISSSRSSSSSSRLEELCFPKASGKRITCKFEVKKTVNPIRRHLCRTRTTNGTNNIRKFLQNTQRSCGVNNRIPSRCDRFLVSSMKMIKRVILHEAKDLIPQSILDHNALIACFDLKSARNTHSLSETLGVGPCNSSLMDPPQSSPAASASTPSSVAGEPWTTAPQSPP